MANDVKHCSFCHQEENTGDVGKLVRGTDPNGVRVAICQTCAELMIDLLDDPDNHDPTIEPERH